MPPGETILGWDEFMAEFAGCLFENGLYRVFDADEAARAAEMLCRYFPYPITQSIYPSDYPSEVLT